MVNDDDDDDDAWWMMMMPLPPLPLLLDISYPYSNTIQIIIDGSIHTSSSYYY